MTNDVKINTIPFNSKLHSSISKAYYGGITEVYSSSIGEGVLYDVKSLYPYVMLTKDMPLRDCY